MGMGLNLATAFIRVRADMSHLGVDLRKARGVIDRRLLSMTVGAGLVFGGLARSLQQVLKYSVVAATGLETIEEELSILTGSAKEAQSIMTGLIDFATKTPFTMPDLLSVTEQMVNFGERGKGLMKTLKMLGDASMGSREKFNTLALVFNQIRGRTYLVAQDFYQLSQRGIISLDDLAKYLGKTRKETAILQQAGKISFEQVRGTLEMLTSAGGRYANMMERMSMTTMGLWSTAIDVINMVAATMGTSLLPAVRFVLNIFIGAGFAISDFVKRGGALLGWALVVTTAVVTLGAAIAALGATMILFKLSWPFFLAGGKMALIFTGIAIAAGFLIGFIAKLTFVQRIFAKTWKMVSDAAAVAVTYIKGILETLKVVIRQTWYQIQVSGAWEKLKATAVGVFGPIYRMVLYVGEAIKNMAAKGVAALSSLFSWVAGQLPSFLGMVVSIGGAFLQIWIIARAISAIRIFRTLSILMPLIFQAVGGFGTILTLFKLLSGITPFLKLLSAVRWVFVLASALLNLSAVYAGLMAAPWIIVFAVGIGAAYVGAMIFYEAIKSIWTVWASLIPKFEESFFLIWEIWQNLSDSVQVFYGIAVEVFTAFYKMVAGVILQVGEILNYLIQDMFQGPEDAMMVFFGAVMDYINSFLDSISILTTDWEMTWDWLKIKGEQALYQIWDSLEWFFNNFGPIAIAGSVTMLGIFETLGRNIFAFFYNTGIRIMKVMKALWAGIKSGLSGESFADAFMLKMRDELKDRKGEMSVKNFTIKDDFNRTFEHFGGSWASKNSAKVEALQKKADEVWNKMKKKRDDKRLERMWAEAEWDRKAPEKKPPVKPPEPVVRYIFSMETGRYGFQEFGDKIQDMLLKQAGQDKQDTTNTLLEASNKTQDSILKATKDNKPMGLA